ncbi:MAG: hypothetical protein ACXVZ3_05900, partial [Gaiellaceae bacterium]
MSLRTRLVVGLVALATVGLVAADVATYHSLRSFLIDQKDQALEADHIQVEHSAGSEGSCTGPGVPLDLFVRIETADQSRILCSTNP